MKIKDIISQPVCIDVYDDVCEELAIAFDGPMALTDCGRKEFSDVLEYEITLHGDYAIVHVDDDDEKVWEHRLARAIAFFHAMAGYCSVTDYDRWFDFS